MAAGDITASFVQLDFRFMQNIQTHTTTLLDADVQSQRELYELSERLAGGLPGLTGNTLLLLRIGVPTPSAGIAFPRALREELRVQLYLDAGPGKHFVRHERPATGANDNVETGRSEGGPVHRLWISRMPIPQKHQVIDRLNL
jgi:hypothetical protein